MIGWYVHHHGSGHLNRMRSVTAALDEEVTVLSSLAPPPDEPRPWVLLERDDTSLGSGAEHATDLAVADVLAGGTLHWAPRHHRGLLARQGQVVEWLARVRPSLVVVDVSVEIGLLVRLCGIPVVVVALPGERTDPAHALAYDQADALLAPWPPGQPTGWPERWTAKAVFTGAISRFDARATGSAAVREPRTVLALWGSGGDGSVHARLGRAEAATGGWRWRRAVAGDGTALPAEEVWQALRSASVVVTHAGQNAVAEVAAARAPAVVLAEPRPFDEQLCTAGRLAGLGAAVVPASWPRDEEWPALLARAESLGGDGWSAWNDGQGAARAAQALSRLARRPGVPARVP